MGLPDKFKFDLSKTEDKLKLFILVSGTLLFLLVATVGGISLTMSPSFCKLCHKAMQPEYVTWEASSHSNIACVECHMEEGVINILIEKVMATKHLYAYLSGHYEEEMPIKMKHELPNEQCEKCHSVKTRNFTLSGDLIVPHEKHGEKGVVCVKCHSGVAHGNIATREVIKKGDDLGAWTPADGVKHMSKEFIRPDMDVCVDCHITPAKYGIEGVKSVTWACEACHKSIFTPKTHAAAAWREFHGIDAAKDVKACASCHAIGISPNLKSDGVKTNTVKVGQAKDFAWSNQFCINCHSKKPKNHQDKNVWMPNHRNAVGAKGMKNCVACHSIQKPEGAPLQSPAKEVACNNCHWFK